MTGVDKVFAGSAIVGGSLFFVRLILFFIGYHGDTDVEVDADVDVDVDVDHDFGGDTDAHFDGVDAHGGGAGEAYAVFKLLSFQSVTAFFMMFGLVGLALRKEAALVEAWSLLGAMCAGAFSFWVIGKIMHLMKGLQSSGTMTVANAIGQEGSIYLTIPAGGVGKVQVTVQDHLRIFSAVARKQGRIRTGERVTVVGVSSGNTLVVEKL